MIYNLAIAQGGKIGEGTCGSNVKKLLCILLVAVAVIAAIAMIGGKSGDPADITVADAAFSLRTQSRADATGFLVGKFQSADGSRLIFDGRGGVKRVEQSYAETEGTCSLSQSSDGSAVLRLAFGDAVTLATFRLVSEDGSFTLTDASGASATYSPVQ